MTIQTFLNGYTNHSGGCPGSDMTWEVEGFLRGASTVAYSFKGHTHDSRYPYVMSNTELEEGFEHVKIADETLNRGLARLDDAPYIKKLICRNWFQIKHAESIFAIGTFVNSTNQLVNGGTGWAVQMGVDEGKNVYFFDQKNNKWYLRTNEDDKFKYIDYIPELTTEFAGIGTRAINDNGTNAITELLDNIDK